MPEKNFGALRNILANLWGYEDYDALLPNDQTDVDSYINRAYFSVWVPEDGTRAVWPERYIGDMLKAPVAATIGLTKGSTAVTGYAFEDKYAGSFVKIGEKFIRYGKKVTVEDPPSTTYHLSVPWDGETGSFAATVYHNAVKLPWSVVEMAGSPTIIGLGLLGPLPGPDAELLLRTEPAFDFERRGGREPFVVHRTHFRQSAYFDTGDPRYYHIDQAGFAPDFTLGNRFHVYPLPERDMTFEFRANAAPNPLEEEEDVPQMPFGTIDQILVPIAKEILALDTTGRRFTGDVRGLSTLADRARNQLRSLRRVQREGAVSMRLRKDW
jgi:hypothetical protein